MDNKLVKGALLLTVAGFISKLLSAGYRIPLQNMTGDLGFYIYQQVYPILGIALVLSLYGFPSAISKVTVDMKGANKQLSITNFYIPLLFILFTINGAIAVVLYFNADTIACWMGNIHLQQGLKLSAFVFIFIPFTALLRGVSQGNYQMKPTALSQIGEQCTRVCIIIAAAAVIAGKHNHIYDIGSAAAIAAIAGGVVALIILIGSLQKQNLLNRTVFFPIPWRYYLKTVAIFGLIAALNHMLLLLIQFADAFTLVPGLVKHSLSAFEAMEAKGVFDRGQPLIQLGTVVGSSFALALIPSISKEERSQSPGPFYFHIRAAMKCSIYLAIGATIGLVMIFPEVNMLLFQDDKGTGSLRTLVVAILLCSVAITAASILQGLGYVKRTAMFILLALLIKWLLNQLLVPLWGLTGSAIATVTSLLVLCCLDLIELKRKLPKLHLVKSLKWRSLIIPGLGMAVYLFFIQIITTMVGIETRVGLLIYVLVVVLTGALVYLLLLIKIGAFTKEEIKLLPFSSLLARFGKGEDVCVWRRK
ncbi:polysaccharide biosynthesis protein [Lentibacillus sp. L22]|uniref:putative polysaccharide biosynthesis protein n=1 Tax=Lentibacillus sp. L22 TaxID=3163028 RepID=UPI0034655AEC